MTNTRTLDEMADHAVTKCMADYEAARAPIPPTAEEQLAAHLAQARFNERIAEHAMMADAHSRALRHIQREAAEVFELRDGALMPKHGQRDPGDPLVDLSPRVWLAQLAKTDAYLFAAPGRAH